MERDRFLSRSISIGIDFNLSVGDILTTQTVWDSYVLNSCPLAEINNLSGISF